MGTLTSHRSVWLEERGQEVDRRRWCQKSRGGGHRLWRTSGPHTLHREWLLSQRKPLKDFKQSRNKKLGSGVADIGSRERLEARRSVRRLLQLSSQEIMRVWTKALARDISTPVTVFTTVIFLMIFSKYWRTTEQSKYKREENIKCNNIHIIGVPEGERTRENICRDYSRKLP